MRSIAGAGTETASPDDHEPPPIVPRGRRFRLALLAVVAVALALRIAFALGVAADLPFGIDADYYHLTAENLAAGDGFTHRPAELRWPTDRDPEAVLPSGHHPPLHSTVLAAANVVGLDTWDQHRLFLSGLGALGVGLVGLVGQRIGGSRVGVVAASIAALHPFWFQYPGFSSSEATFVLVMPALLLAALVALERRTAMSMVVLGAACALAALTRSEAALFTGVLGIPVALLAGRSRRLRSVALVLATALLVVAPWVRWMHLNYGELTLSVQGGQTLLISNCKDTYDGEAIGLPRCGFAYLALAGWGVPEDLTPARRSAAIDANARHLAIEYAKAHKGRLPAVAMARLGRTFGVYAPTTSIDFDRSIGAHPPTQRVGTVVHLLLLPLVLAGGVLLWQRRRRRHLLVLASGFALAVTAGTLVYGATRMRLAAEPAIAVLAAVALCALAERVIAARRGRPGHHATVAAAVPVEGRR